MDHDLKIDYRFMQPDDAEEVCALIAQVFNTFIAPDYSPEGAAEFLIYVRPDVMRKRLRRNYFGVVASVDDRIVGMIEMKDYAHISLLFVDGPFQGQGIGRALWTRALAHCRETDPTVKEITVNSARSAIPVYRHFGFVPIGPEETRSGIQFTPMILELSDSR
jgi:GNAT superfamily N-acetyltransferase